jgi:hypothetical protein
MGTESATRPLLKSQSPREFQTSKFERRWRIAERTPANWTMTVARGR